MDVIILAAGLGTRLRPHTLTVPKPLLPVRGRPILDWALGALPQEVDRVLVVVHYAADLAALARTPAGLLVQAVDEPRRFGIAFLKPDGSLERLVEKPDLEGKRLANTGAYLFPRDVFTTELTLSARGEYEITDYVSALAARRPVQVIQAGFWFPIGTVEA